MKYRLQAAKCLIIICVLLLAGCNPQVTVPSTDPSLPSSTEQATDVGNSSSLLEVHFIDVGQADAILIKLDSHAMLIDAGNNADSELVVDYIEQQKVESLDFVIGTHPHEDHIGGLDAVIEALPVSTVIMPKVTTTTQTFADVLTAISEADMQITTPEVGATYTLGQATWTILAPQEQKYNNLNNYSVVVRLTFGDNHFIFTGDAEVESETEILAYYQQDLALLQADVLKVGHHGSVSSSSSAFLDAVKPQYAVISCGRDNDYGHPHQEVLQELNTRAIELYRTDEQGTIVAISDGSYVSWETELDKAAVIISDLDKRAESITITNVTEQDIDLGGWKIVSVLGQETYTFAQGYKLKAYDSVTIVSGGAEGDLVWKEGHVWNNTKYDPAELYDLTGQLVARFE